MAEEVLHNNHIWKSGEVVTENQEDIYTLQGGLPGQVHPQGDQPWFPRVLLVNKHEDGERTNQQVKFGSLLADRPGH